MKTTYIQFDAPKNDNLAPDGPVKRSLKKVIVGLLTTAIPKANPDFENRIDDVEKWFVECETESGIPQREIGFDTNGKVILKMPFKDNYGYWTDNNLLLADFYRHFLVSEINKEDFEKNWALFQ